MFRARYSTIAASATLIVMGALSAALCASPSLLAQSKAEPSQSAASNAAPKFGHYVSALPRGTKLMLKSGSYELVREYYVQGDRVRYYDVDRAQWEFVPTALIDWNATQEQEAEEEKSQQALIAKVKKQEAEHNADQPLDIDASLEVAPGVFLPPGVGLFAFNGKSVMQMPQAQTDSRLSKKHFLEQVLVPVPILPTRHVVSIPGEHSKFRLNNQPEFYLRTESPKTPDVELIRTKVRGGDRQILNLDQLMGAEQTKSDTLPMQQWVIAKNVYRYTLSKRLSRGEYVIAEILPNEGMSLYVWDFGVN
jgi:hypothetical protein